MLLLNTNLSGDNMKRLLILLLLTSCASNPIDKRREKVLACTKELIEYDASTKNAYLACKDIYSRQE